MTTLAVILGSSAVALVAIVSLVAWVIYTIGGAEQRAASLTVRVADLTRQVADATAEATRLGLALAKSEDTCDHLHDQLLQVAAAALPALPDAAAVALAGGDAGPPGEPGGLPRVDPSGIADTLR